MKWRSAALGAVVCLASGGCASEVKPDRVPVPARVIDLSPTLDPNSPRELLGGALQRGYGFPETLPFTNRIGDPVYSLFTTVTLVDHVGAHNDAPSHLIPGGSSTEDLPLESFIGPATLLDFRSAPRDRPLTRSDFEGREILPGDVVLVLTGYQPPTGPDELPSYPYLDADAAEYLASIPVRAFGSDAPSLGSFRRYPGLIAEEATSEHVVPEHLAFLSRSIPNIEGLTGLEQLLGLDHVVFAGFPLKVKGTSGGLMRAVALVY